MPVRAAAARLAWRGSWAIAGWSRRLSDGNAPGRHARPAEPRESPSPAHRERGRHVVSPQLSRWEYLEVFVNKSEWRDGRGQSGTLPEARREDQESGRGVRGAGTAAVAGRLAKGGWELASTIPSGAAGVYRLVFRRIKGVSA